MSGNSGYKCITTLSDGAVSSIPSTLKSVTITPAGSITAGVVAIYNDTDDETAAQLVFKMTVPTGFLGQTFLLDVQCHDGIYAAFDGTLAGVNVTVIWNGA